MMYSMGTSTNEGGGKGLVEKGDTDGCGGGGGGGLQSSAGAIGGGNKSSPDPAEGIN